MAAGATGGGGCFGDLAVMSAIISRLAVNQRILHPRLHASCRPIGRQSTTLSSSTLTAFLVHVDSSDYKTDAVAAESCSPSRAIKTGRLYQCKMRAWCLASHMGERTVDIAWNDKQGQAAQICKLVLELYGSGIRQPG